MDVYTVNTVKVSKMFLGFLIFAVSLNVDNTCDDQKQLPYWVYAISLHMGLLTLLATYLIFVTPTTRTKLELICTLQKGGMQCIVYIVPPNPRGGENTEKYCSQSLATFVKKLIHSVQFTHLSWHKIGSTNPLHVIYSTFCQFCGCPCFH